MFCSEKFPVVYKGTDKVAAPKYFSKSRLYLSTIKMLMHFILAAWERWDAGWDFEKEQWYIFNSDCIDFLFDIKQYIIP